MKCDGKVRMGFPFGGVVKWRGPVQTVLNRAGLRQPVMILLDIVTNLLEPNSLILMFVCPCIVNTIRN